MKTFFLLIVLSLLPRAYSQDEKTSTDEVVSDPSQAIKNNYAIGPFDREGNYNPSANMPDEKYIPQAMEETPELMEEPKEDN